MNHHTLIRSLIARIRALEQEQEYGLDAQASAYYRTQQRMERLRRELEQERRDTEYEASYRQGERERALRDLKRAQSYGNDWEAQRATERLRRYI